MTRAELILRLAVTGLCMGQTSWGAGRQAWRIETTEDWQRAQAENRDMSFEDGMAVPTAEAAAFRSVMHRFEAARIPDAISGFEIQAPAVDERTQSTGKQATYRHPHWRQHPDWDSNVAEYTVHGAEQNAFGDWAAISIGGQYYLFCDYHPANDKIRVAWFTSDSIDKPFTRGGERGSGHPDPDIAFAEGRFYLVTQMKTDFVSSGPWVEEITVRVGADTDNDGQADAWTDWQTVRERYDYIEGFAKQVARTPASLDLSGLPACFGVCFEFKVMDKTANASTPVVDSVTVLFEEE